LAVKGGRKKGEKRFMIWEKENQYTRVPLQILHLSRLSVEGGS
jgi:hypothetical protein